MKFTILGCGTSTGVPVAGCQCGVCRSGKPRNSRLRCSAFISAGPTSNVLIDASPDLRQQALREDIRRIDAVLYTHTHSDHILGTDDLRAFNFVTHARIPCFGTQETLDSLASIFSYIFDPDPSYMGGLLAQLDRMVIDDHTPFTAAGLRFQPIPLRHGRMPVLGFRCGEVAYATDCNHVPDDSMNLLRGVRYLVLDGLRYEPHRTHFTIPDSIRVAREIGAEQTYLTHMTHTVDYDEVSSRLPDGIALAYDGLSFEFQGERASEISAHSGPKDFRSFELSTTRLTLRAIDLSYRDIIFSEFTDEITTYMFPHRGSDPSGTESFINNALRTMREGSNVQLVILKRETQEFLGCAGLHDIGSEAPELGIWLKKAAHGHRYGVEVIGALVDWARRHLAFDHLRYPVDENNIPSRKIPEALGGAVGQRYSRTSMSGKLLNLVEYCIPRRV